MSHTDPKQRTIMIGQASDLELLDTASSNFLSDLQDVIDRNNMVGVKWHINTQPQPNMRDEDGKPVTQMFAKVTWPAQTSRVGVMELEDFLDMAHQGPKNPLPPL